MHTVGSIDLRRGILMHPYLTLGGALPALLQFGPAVMAIPWITRLVTRHISAGRNPDQVALTFDDGPHPDGTPAILDILDDFGVRATFFLVGEQVRRYPHIARDIVGRGHDVGVHGWTHRSSARLGPLATGPLIRRAFRTVSDVTGTSPRWYRPPYGVATGAALRAARALGMTPIWWTSHGRDWSDRDPGSITRRILRAGTPGSHRLDGRDVLLLHDSDRYAQVGSWRQTAAAVPHILSALQMSGRPVGPLG